MAVTSGPSVAADPADAFSLEQPRSAWSLSLPLMVGLGLFAFLTNATGLLLSDPDSHWHIAVGNWILVQGSVPVTDTFSFTYAGQPWIAKEWLSQLALAGAHNLGGWAGVTALCSAAIAVTFALLLRLLLADLKPLPALMFTATALIMMAPHLLARPHVLAFPFILWWVAGLVRAVEQRRAPGSALLFAMLMWANLHGGFTLGLMLAAAFALDAVVGARDVTERRALFIAWAKFGVAALLVACITPYGPESILVTLRIFGLGEALGTIAEWRSPDFQKQPLQEVVLLLAAYLALSRGLRLPLIRLLIVIGLLHLFLRHARNAELLATLVPIMIAPLLARQFPSIAADRQARGRMNALARPAGLAATTLCLGLGGLLAGVIIGLGAIAPPSANVPASALTFAREAGLKGRVLNHYNYGGFLIGAGVPTYIDGRGELYGGDFIKRYAETVNLRGEEPFENLLERERIDWTLLPTDQPANQLLSRLPGWRRAYGDDTAVIFVRSTSP